MMNRRNGFRVDLMGKYEKGDKFFLGEKMEERE